MEPLLIERCRVGDAAAIESFVQTYQHELYRLALSILDDATEAEEATQDALLAALRSLESFRGASNLRTWLYSITVNLCRTRLRRRNTYGRLTTLLGELLRTRSTPSVEENTIRSESNEALWRALRGMSEKHRIPVVLRYYHDLSVTEIASILQIPEGTVHSRLNTARRQLHEALKEGQA